MAKKGLTGKFARKAVTRLMDKVGGRLVSGMTDTSSDAPASCFKPKRDLYAKIAAEEEQGQDAE